MIEITSVTTHKSGFQDFSITFRQGEHWVIRGKNGSGKTALLELISGKLTATSGQVRYDFVDEHAEWSDRYHQRISNVHYIPVNALHDILGFQPDLFYQQRYYTVNDETSPTVRIFFGESITGLKRLKLPSTFNIETLLELPLSRLSNGQIKKVILTKHLLKNIPKVLLLDYPFEGLDRDSRHDLCNFLDHLANDFKIHIILTDHHHELPTVINKQLVIEEFKLIDIRIVEQKPQQNPGFNLPVTKPPRQGEAVVKLEALTIQYGNKKIIDNLNWTIYKGERWALTGRNGSGKTTLFSLIFADHPLAYSQKVFLFGKRRGSGESIWDIKKRINYLGPERIHFLDHHQMNARVCEFMESSNQSSKDPDELFKYFNLTTFANKHLYELSSGQLQLVLLISFFLVEKELLLLDEPFQFLDNDVKELVSRYLTDYLHEDSTMVLITHYERDIEQWTEHRLQL